MTRSSIALVLFIAFFASCKQKEGDIITDIKKKSGEINKNLKDYKIKRADDLTTTAKGAIIGYYREDEVKKISSERYTDQNRTFSEYYFDDGMLIQIIQQQFVYNRPVSYTEENAKANNDSEWYDDKKTKLEVNRFYFSKNKLIKWVVENKDLSVSPQNFTDKESELWAETAILIKELNEQ
jgi:hypothetical protein